MQVHEPPFIVIEEVVPFRTRGLPLIEEQDMLGLLYAFQTIELGPRDFRLPINRPRMYCIGVHRRLATLSRPLSELLKSIVLHAASWTGLDFFFMKLPKEILSASRQEIFDDYQSEFGRHANVFDLTQYPLKRPRALLRDNSLPTITKGCRFFGSHVHRFLHGVEALVGQGWPLHPAMNGFNAPRRDHFLSLAPTLSSSFAGN